MGNIRSIAVGRAAAFQQPGAIVGKRDRRLGGQEGYPWSCSRGGRRGPELAGKSKPSRFPPRAWPGPFGHAGSYRRRPHCSPGHPAEPAPASFRQPARRAQGGAGAHRAGRRRTPRSTRTRRFACDAKTSTHAPTAVQRMPGHRTNGAAAKANIKSTRRDHRPHAHHWRSDYQQSSTNTEEPEPQLPHECPVTTVVQLVLPRLDMMDTNSP